MNREKPATEVLDANDVAFGNGLSLQDMLYVADVIALAKETMPGSGGAEARKICEQLLVKVEAAIKRCAEEDVMLRFPRSGFFALVDEQAMVKAGACPDEITGEEPFCYHASQK